MQRFFLILALMIATATAFVSPSTFIGTSRSADIDFATPLGQKEIYQPPALKRQRKSVTFVQTQSLFGLGAPELAVILIAAAFLLGPSKLAELGKDAGKIAGELKEVPKEFQKGMAEGEEQAKVVKQELMGDTDEKKE
mmetsp:Transcript_18223/g.27554  ORF Transcript_18223/g.27554 Transcript_18223/m.27554 type:complete len:138 (+) Transcript_18223:54-467(+)|eukprot:CAMPEP_0178912838 /NCGR_PEP_ID=MMETSP0786-20121207/10496_1 /TAXON_ID=186022 /ORGANISM="Thalassionema frauenfeldii, Strain CCMP 1798" /LENGTH=137 /DNA_ID=CAMNT_0020585487 /DNA_START=49 /DNA_END=462 /DNA_ORIENTATION=+